jgi:hypothetical protein
LALARAIRTDDIDDLDLSQVRAHSLIVRGEKDGWVEPTVAKKLATELPGCRIVNFPDIARLVPEEAPEELADLIASFVSPHVSRAGEASESVAESLAEPFADIRRRIVERLGAKRRKC